MKTNIDDGFNLFHLTFKNLIFVRYQYIIQLKILVWSIICIHIFSQNGVTEGS